MALILSWNESLHQTRLGAEGLLERAGITDEFEKVMSVADGPAWKPAAESYRRVLEVCGVQADEAMLVAVHPWDIDGAARAGLRTGWLRRGGRRLPVRTAVLLRWRWLISSSWQWC